MKKDIHPKTNSVIFEDQNSGARFFALSTAKGNETVKVDGKEYQLIKIEISSDSHPFYTGKQALIDTAGRVNKFKARVAKQAVAADARKGKKAKKVKSDARKVTAKKIAK
jgi:large subunit ribosomal protein L31